MPAAATKTMILFPPLPEEEVRALAEVGGDALTVVNAPDEETARAQLAAGAAAFYGRITPGLLEGAPALRWVQTPMAGLEHYVFPALVAHPLTLTNMRGVYNDHIADHAWMFVLAFARGLHVYARRQQKREWNPAGVPVIHLADATLGIIGLGGIGYEVARRGRVAGMHVLAVDPRRTDKPADIDELAGPNGLNDLLARSDFVVICAPQTPETEKMIRRPQLEMMKPAAYLVNIGRGVIVDLADLTQALQNGVIAGAGLDVFEIEPLPEDHPLWAMPNVLLTPHTAGQAPHTAARRLSVVCENVRRFVAGEPLTNVVDKANWF